MGGHVKARVKWYQLGTRKAEGRQMSVRSASTFPLHPESLFAMTPALLANVSLMCAICRTRNSQHLPTIR